jgi:hypothetical protein
MRVAFDLTKREAEAILKSQLREIIHAHATRKTQAQQTAEFKLREAIIAAQSEEGSS